jgi:hypothetical protein
MPADPRLKEILQVLETHRAQGKPLTRQAVTDLVLFSLALAT